MQYAGQAQAVATRILEAFKAGDVPKALAPVFIHRRDNVPCRAWSWNNQLLVALAGTSDARGFRQWQEIGRHVRKGERAFGILAPLVRKLTATDTATGQAVERTLVYGFRSVPVFGLEQTDGAPLAGDCEAQRFLNALPLVQVARAWGLSVESYTGRPGAPLGKYRLGASIALGVENLATWAHELIHAADHRLGHLTETGQHWRSECVAELGGAVLLECIGYDVDSDRGGAWAYVQAYAKDAKREPLAACLEVVKRTCEAVAFLLEASERLQSPQGFAPQSEAAGG